MENLEFKTGTKVFKKSTPNGKVTVYIGKRDYLDRNGKVDPIDGIILVDPEYSKDRKVFVHLLAAFRYGREDLDVLGLTFRKDLYLDYKQIYPEEKKEDIARDEDKFELTKLQSRLLEKLGENAYPFHFQLPHLSPASVTLQPSPEDIGKPCGVDYELKVYIANDVGEKIYKRNSVKLAIRKLTYASPTQSIIPCEKIVKEFRLNAGKIKMEVSLLKDIFFHGESILVQVLVDNNSTKTIKRIKVQVLQIADILLFSRAAYKCVVDELESENNFPITPGQSKWSCSYTLCPLLSKNRHKRGLALDGKLRHEDTNLASSTVIQDNDNIEDLGIIVSYKVRVRLVLGFGSSDITLDLPFTLTHKTPINNSNRNNSDNLIPTEEHIDSQAEQEDDLIFEDFTRLRLDI